MRNTAVVVSLKTFAKIACQSRIEALGIDFTLQDVDVSKSHELELACRGVACDSDVSGQKRSGFARATPRQASLATSSRVKPGGEGS
jgi:hypothetical protein